ncbi:hypothetical protein DES53_102234 [Roseimicrobium gellanilyticum]|uniref:Uncharacterized protein n=1 Tax=Roseimicrobium gellanilyticum TaxID=748857 RepID=A0A366HQC7_9BACT|nr:hypothetical protein [Roseimicrobium gellanilyticum]RBP45851.1 hypothetical protein DES53_102234 [Roseimicrobium gellanilyticum]
MSSPDSAELSAATLHLYRITGVVGLLLMKSGNQLANHMPFADVRTNELGAHVMQMAAGYGQVKRRVRQVLMLFDSGTLLIVMKEQIQLALMLTPQADLDKASLAAGAFLMDYAAQLDAAAPTAKLEKEPEKPKPVAKPESDPVVVPVAFAAEEPVREKALMAEPVHEAWPKVTAILESILGKVMGNAQAVRLINRMSEAKHGNDVSKISPADAKVLARAVLEQVPNKSKRDALLSELDHALAEAKL